MTKAKHIFLLTNFYAEFSCRFNDFKMIESELSLSSYTFAFVVDEAPEKHEHIYIYMYISDMWLFNF